MFYGRGSLIIQLIKAQDICWASVLRECYCVPKAKIWLFLHWISRSFDLFVLNRYNSFTFRIDLTHRLGLWFRLGLDSYSLSCLSFSEPPSWQVHHVRCILRSTNLTFLTKRVDIFTGISRPRFALKILHI